MTKGSCKRSHQRCSIKKAVLKNFAIFTGDINRSIPVLQSLFNKVQSLRSETLLKKTPTQVFSLLYCEIFKSTYFEEHLRTAASGAVVFTFVFYLHFVLRRLRIQRITRKGRSYLYNSSLLPPLIS